MSKKGSVFTFNVLLKKEDDLYIAHCLELDIVAANTTVARAKKDLIDLIGTQLSYAFSNDNLDNLFHPAPPEVWQEFLACIEKKETKTHPIKPVAWEDNIPDRIIPEFFDAHTCVGTQCVH